MRGIDFGDFGMDGRLDIHYRYHLHSLGGRNVQIDGRMAGPNDGERDHLLYTWSVMMIG